MTATTVQETPKTTIGFWRCWAMSVGVMIGSGIFLLPAVLAPYGSISLLGWVTTSLGVIGLALVLGRLANRTPGVGGPYAYARGAFGDLPGFLIGWGYWISVTIAITAVALAFAGYLGAIIPVLGQNSVIQTGIAFLAIWTFTLINIRGIAEAAWMQLVLTVLKIIPLLVIIVFGAFAGSVDTLPPFNPTDMPVGKAIATTALLTMWAFIGVEAAVIPAGDVTDARRTIPRAVISAALSVALIYVLSTIAVMMLVPSASLAASEAPFMAAAEQMGPWGAGMIAAGALLATAGSLNGNVLVAGQMPMAVALDRLAPEVLAQRNKGHSPVFSVLLSSILASLLLCLNFTEDLIGAFTFLISISTLCVLAPYGVSALAELKSSWKSARGWGFIALLTVAYSILAASGSGITVLLWGVVLMAAGLPVFFVFKRTIAARPGKIAD